MVATTTEATTNRAHLPSLTGIRVPLAALVFTNHAGVSNVYRDDTVNFLMAGLTACIGEGAVGYFFALSGFVLTWSVRANDTPRTFIRRRLAKIGPNHVLTWTIGLLLMIAVGDFSGVTNVLPALFLVHSWIPVMEVVQGTNGPSWSLSAELFFYCSFPFALPFFLRIRPENLWRWLYVIGGIAVCVPLLSLLLPKDPIVFDVIPLNRFWFIAFAPPVRALDFILGVIVARIVIEGLWRPVRTRTIAGALLGAWIIGLAVPPPYAWVAPFFLPIVLLLGTFATADVEGRPTRFSTKRMVWLGEVTFAFYVLHWLVLHYSHMILFDNAEWGYLGATAFLLGCLAFTTALGGLVFERFEKPMYRRFAKKKPGPAAVTRDRPGSGGEPPETGETVGKPERVPVG